MIIAVIVSSPLSLALSFSHHRSIQEHGEMKIEQRIDEVSLTCGQTLCILQVKGALLYSVLSATISRLNFSLTITYFYTF